MTKDMQGLVLTGLGLIIVRLAAGTAYLNYVKGSMRPLLIGAGIVLIVLGMWLIVESVRARRAHPEPASHTGPRSAWLLFVPILAILLIAPPPLGAYSAARASTNAVILDMSMAPMPAADPAEMILADYVTRAVADQGKDLEGRTVELTGFVLPQSDGTWLLARMQIICCAADAYASKIRPVNVPRDAANLAANTWVTVTGTYLADPNPDATVEIPLVSVSEIRAVPQPENPYE
jgi:uncharacterized repeat protein (TIGR03943 family)